MQKIQNRAGRVITGSSYDVKSADVLNTLKWKTLETRHFHTKATLMYKILNDLSAPQLSNSYAKLSDTNINFNLRNIHIFPRPYTNFLKRSFKYGNVQFYLWGKDRTIAIGFQTQTCLFTFHAFYWIALIPCNILFIITCLPTPHLERLETSFRCV